MSNFWEYVGPTAGIFNYQFLVWSFPLRCGASHCVVDIPIALWIFPLLCGYSHCVVELTNVRTGNALCMRSLHKTCKRGINKCSNLSLLYNIHCVFADQASLYGSWFTKWLCQSNLVVEIRVTQCGVDREWSVDPSVFKWRFERLLSDRHSSGVNSRTLTLTSTSLPRQF